MSRDPHTGKIIRACDDEASLGDNYPYEICEDVTGQVFTNSELSIIWFSTGPTVCIDPPVASEYGYLNRTWDGTKDIQVSKVAKNSKSIFNQFSVHIGQLLL